MPRSIGGLVCGSALCGDDRRFDCRGVVALWLGVMFGVIGVGAYIAGARLVRPNWLWFEGEQLHFDAPAYALARGISLDEAVTELRELAGQLLPAARLSEMG